MAARLPVGISPINLAHLGDLGVGRCAQAENTGADLGVFSAVEIGLQIMLRRKGKRRAPIEFSPAIGQDRRGDGYSQGVVRRRCMRVLHELNIRQPDDQRKIRIIGIVGIIFLLLRVAAFIGGVKPKTRRQSQNPMLVIGGAVFAVLARVDQPEFRRAFGVLDRPIPAQALERRFKCVRL